MISFETEGLDFVMTALLVVIFLEQWMKEKDHTSGVIGIVLTVICLVVFGNKNFIIPSMLGILGVLTLMRGRLERRIGE